MKYTWEEMFINVTRRDGKYYDSEDIVIGVVKCISPIQRL